MTASRADVVVRDPGAVCRAYFVQGGSGFCHHIGDAEGATDLDQFSTGDDDLAGIGQSVEGQ